MAKGKGDERMDKEAATALFNTLYSSTYSRVFAYVYSHVRDTADTDDIIQTVYTSFFKRLLSKGDTDEETAVKILFTAARHELSRCYGFRKQAQESVPLDDPDITDKLEYELSENISGLTEDDKLLLKAIWTEVEDKGELTKRLFVLHFKYGLPVAKCAELLEITSANATSRLYRAIKDIRNNLERSEAI